MASFTKNESPVAIIFVLKTDSGIQNLTRKKIIADRRIIAAGDLFLVKLASGLIFSFFGISYTYATLMLLFLAIFHAKLSISMTKIYLQVS